MLGERSDEEDTAEGDRGLEDNSVDDISVDIEDTVTESSSSRSTTPVSNMTKRKRSKGEVMEDVMSKVMKNVTEGLQESDKMYLELEEKRMKFEEQQRREERDFKLQMMRILVGSTHPPSHPADPHGQYYPTYPPYAP